MQLRFSLPRSFAIAFFAVALFAFQSFAADAFRLYLKDGTYQLTREYQIKADRVRYYSTERDDWEEIPLTMVDLDRTKKEIADRDAETKAEVKADAEEDNALREAAKQVQQIPEANGVYYIRDEKLETMKVAESKVVSDKKRSVLKVLSPMPVVAGKETVELDGLSAELRVAGTRPEFYFRLSNEERFAIIKLTPTRKNSRIVESVEVVPITKELEEHFDEIECFKRQVGDLLFKVWPEKDLDPGEYALVEHTEGQINVQVWDFGVGAPNDAPEPAKKRKWIP